MSKLILLQITNYLTYIKPKRVGFLVRDVALTV